MAGQVAVQACGSRPAIAVDQARSASRRRQRLVTGAAWSLRRVSGCSAESLDAGAATGHRGRSANLLFGTKRRSRCRSRNTR